MTSSFLYLQDCVNTATAQLDRLTAELENSSITCRDYKSLEYTLTAIKEQVGYMRGELRHQLKGVEHAAE